MKAARVKKKHNTLARISIFCTGIMLAVTLMSMISLAADAQGLARDCKEGTVWSAAQGKCVPMITVPIDLDFAEAEPTNPPSEVEVVEPTEEPAIDVTIEAEEREDDPVIDTDVDVIPESTVEAAVGETSTILINKHACPVGYDASAEDFNDLAANCQGDANGIGFGVSDGATEIANGTTGDAGPNMVTFDGLPSGAKAIYEKPGANPVTSVIFCSSYYSDSPQNFLKMDETAEGQIFYGFMDGENLYCDWFNVPATGMGSARLVINKVGCPVGYDASAEDYYDLALNCHDQLDGIGFGVSDGASEIATQDTGDVMSSGIDISGLPAGPLAIYEKPLMDPTTSVIFCDGRLPTDNGSSDYQKMSQTDVNQIFYIFDEDETLFCDWYNIPFAGSVGTPTASGDTTIIINKHPCPVGYDASAENFNDMAQNCQGDANGIGFGVSDGATEIAVGNTGDAFPNGVQFDNLPAGAKAIYEKPGAEPVSSVIFCSSYVDGGPQNFEKMLETAEGQIFYDFAEGENLYCDWFNVPASGMGTARVVINKVGCPVGYDATAEDYYDLAFNCHEQIDGIEFGVSDGASEIASQTTGDVMTSGIDIEGLPTGPLAIYEKNAADTTSVVFCDGRVPTDNGASDYQKMFQGDADQIFYIFDEEETLFCDWYNVPAMPDMGTPTAEGYGDITIYKWLCPEGYDPTELGAEPIWDCAEPLNGVTFTLDRPTLDPLQSTTGDSVPGAVSFGSQEAGDYTLTETYPDGIDQAFVWECTGGSTPQVHPTPLNSGASFSFTLASEDSLVCNWYNVPTDDPEYGDVTVYKYICSGEVYTSEVDCEIYEEGVKINLYGWAGSDWAFVDSDTTSNTGQINWTDLTPGSYVIEEVGNEPCYITSTYQDGEEHILVAAGTETVVKVYNCTTPGETPVTGKPPIKYPNTGVAPSSFASTAMQESTPDGEPCREVSEPTSKDESVTPVATAEPISGATCPRGEVPISVSVESIDVSTNIEVLETVDGEMQAPTTAEVVAWYKETERLGESGNIVLAGHLNYWGVPEGVFFNLANVKEGDVITVTGDQGGVFEYVVTSVEELAIVDGPDEALATGDAESLTLITCGGDWDSSASEYQSRTVVKAERK